MASRLWLPTDAKTATPAGWFNAKDETLFNVDSSTGKVSEARSKVGGWKVTQANAAVQPTRNATGRNNLPVILMPGSSIMSGPGGALLPTGSAPGMQTGVAAYLTKTADYATLIAYGARNQRQLRTVSAHSNKVSVGYFGNDQDGNANWLGVDRMFTASITETGSSTIIADATLTATAALQPLQTPTGTTFYIGGGSNGDNWGNQWQELILWAGILSDDERQMLFGYFAWQWGLVDRLPAGHAYKAGPPMFNDGVATIYLGAGSRTSRYLGVRSDADLYLGAGKLFP